jgi:hypothetical protein
VETILVHKDLVGSKVFTDLIDMLQQQKVKLNSGPLLHKMIKFAPPLARSLRTEYSDLEVTIEIVDSVQDAVGHINQYGSHHTDTIVTENGEIYRILHFCSFEILYDFLFQGMWLTCSCAMSTAHACSTIQARACQMAIDSVSAPRLAFPMAGYTRVAQWVLKAC